MILDVDHFKRFNDLHGNAAKEERLRRVVEALASSKRRTSDCAARYGGEEMALILTRADRSGAFNIVESTRKAVEALVIELENGPMARVTARPRPRSYNSGALV